ncbi:uncharacterized protein LOC121706390 [Tachysurus ichikawai]
MTLWWEYEEFSVARAGYAITVYYRNQLWVEFSQPAVPCTDLKICNIVKGETLTETLSLPINSFNFPEGEYRLQGHLSIIDDLELEINISINATLQTRYNNSSVLKFDEFRRTAASVFFRLPDRVVGI